MIQEGLATHIRRSHSLSASPYHTLSEKNNRALEENSSGCNFRGSIKRMSLKGDLT